VTPPATLELARELIRFDTVNPPGAEKECVRFLAGVLDRAGVESTLLGAEPDRPNLIARVRGRGEAPPLLLQGHVDVVTTEGQDWRRPPFGGDVEDGYLWGRGALDMKGSVAMMTTAFLGAAAAAPPGDVILCVLADEEAGGLEGASWLVDQHPEQFAGVRHALGEGGGYSFDLGGRRFYGIMVSEKRGCRLRAVLRGPGGHASRPLRGAAVAKLGHLLVALDGRRLPVHVTAPMQMMLADMSAALGGRLKEQVGQLLDPERADAALDAMGSEAAARFDSVLHNTATPTIVRGGSKINVIPAEVSVDLDGRLLPGSGPEDMHRELRPLIGDEVELQQLDLGPEQPEPELGDFFETLRAIIREADPEGVPVPQLTAGGTDGRHFARLGIRTYGYVPVRMPPGFTGEGLFHAADERIPVEGLAFGAAAIEQAILRYRG
jgi:acetylornithine deacetylase/succinyl-diaminopimelate desuccinylase-like protein